MLLAEGGNGGFGNAHFKSSTNRAPRRANPGRKARRSAIWLRLKLIADAGLVGLPNAGKSTFLAAVTRGQAEDRRLSLHHAPSQPRRGPRIDGREFVLADIPGLIEGAHEGAGLGDRFLGHVERCRVLLHLVDATGEDPAEAYQTVRARARGLWRRARREAGDRRAVNKVDALDADELEGEAKALLKRAAGRTPLVLSGATGEGVDDVLRCAASTRRSIATPARRGRGAADRAGRWTP